MTVEYAGVTWLSIPEVADQLGLTVTKVHQLRRERQLVALRTEEGMRVPADFLDDGVVVKHLPGVLTLLADGGYGDEDSVRWLFTADDSLPGTPIAALRANRGTEVKRRAQASAL